MASKSSMCITEKDRVCLSVSNTTWNTEELQPHHRVEGTDVFIVDLRMKRAHLSGTVNVDGADVQVTEGHLHLQTHTSSLY